MRRNWEFMAPSAIYSELSSNFGEADWVGWDPHTVLAHIEDATDVGQDKILATQAFAFNTKLASTEAVAFENISHAFCNNHCVFDAHQPLELPEAAYAVKQMRELAKLVHGPKFELEFAGEIPSYIAAIAKFRGFYLLPQSLAFAQGLLNHLTGLAPGSPKYQESEKLLTAAESVLGALGASPKLEDVIAHLEREDALTDFTRAVVGCVVFDPTK